MAKLKENSTILKSTGEEIIATEESVDRKLLLKADKDDLDAHKAENATQAHLAKNIGLEDTAGNFIATELEGAMQELFTSVSNGKTLVGTAITDKASNDIIVPTNPSFQQLADAIMLMEALPQFTAGDTTRIYKGIESTNNETYYVKTREVRINFNGSIRVRFGIANIPYGQSPVYGKIYINGSPVGKELESETSHQFETYLEQDFNVRSGDLVQLYLKGATDAYAKAQTFEISVAEIIGVTSIL